jgi:hypothetical protein
MDGPRGYNGFRDLPRPALFTIPKEQVRKVTFRQLIDQILCSHLAAGIKTHIQRCFHPERKPALRRIQLHRRNPEI